MNPARKLSSDLDEKRADSLAREVKERIDTDPRQGYYDEIGAYMLPLRKYPTLISDGEYALLFRAYRSGNTVEERRRARDLLVYRNIRLVLSVALRKTGRGLPLLDMLQEGVFGLMRAMESYDLSLGLRFSTYAIHWIRQTITRAIADNNVNRPYRIPVHLQEKMQCVRRAVEELIKELCRVPDDHEIWAHLQRKDTKLAQSIRLVDVARCRRFLVSGDVSLDEPLGWQRDGHGASEETYGDVVVSHPPAADVVADARAMLEQFRKALLRVERELEELSPRHAMIVRLRFGIGEFDPMTLEQIAERYELTRERIRQIEAKALEELERRLGVNSKELEGLVQAVEEISRLIASV